MMRDRLLETGFALFAGKGRCALCHDGPYFTDQQFHNVGLPTAGAPYDLGRAAGLPLVRASAFNCRSLNNSHHWLRIALSFGSAVFQASVSLNCSGVSSLKAAGVETETGQA